MSEEVKSPSAEELHVIFIRHGKTTDNAKGVISGGVADPDLVPEGRDQAKEANKVYKALETKGLVNNDTPLFTTDRTRAVDTAKFFTGREDGANIKTDQRLLERLLGDWDSKLTERLQKEVKAIDGFSPPNEEKPADHKAHVVESLDQRINEADGKPFMIVSHGGTTRRIAAYFGIEEGLEVQNAIPHHAISKDGGKSWEVKKFSIDEKGQLQEEVLPKKLPKAVSIDRTLESILEEHVPKASLSKGKSGSDILTIETDKLKMNKEVRDALAEDLGQLLIGKHHKDEGAVRVEGADVVVKMDKVQAEILREFAKQKGVEISTQSAKIG